jgi:prepilin-type N-terminal cleavage/methylation domain-containing protein
VILRRVVPLLENEVNSIKTSDRGFSLIELVVVVGLVVIVTTATIGLIASISKRAEPDINRDLAMMTAQNTLERARAAAAYFPLAQSQAESDAVAQVASSQDKSFILDTNKSFSVSVPLPTSTCGVNNGAVTAISLNVTTTLNVDVFDVKVTYPTAACSPNAVTNTVELSETMPVSSYIPGTHVYQILAHEPTEQ